MCCCLLCVIHGKKSVAQIFFCRIPDSVLVGVTGSAWAKTRGGQARFRRPRMQFFSFLFMLVLGLISSVLGRDRTPERKNGSPGARTGEDKYHSSLINTISSASL